MSRCQVLALSYALFEKVLRLRAHLGANRTEVFIFKITAGKQNTNGSSDCQPERGYNQRLLFKDVERHSLGFSGNIASFSFT